MSSPQSLLDIRRRRQHDRFVGRREEITWFESNLKLPLDDNERKFIINITGQGGVGKTWLSKRFRDIVQNNNAMAAYIDETIHDVPDAMGKIAEQLEKEGGAFIEFNERYRVYLQKRQEIESDPEKPVGLASLIGGGVGRALHKVVKHSPAGIFSEWINEETLAEQFGAWTDFVVKKISNKDEQKLILKPVEILTPIFLKNLFESSQSKLCSVFIDTFEQNSRILEPWLIDLLNGKYGDEIPLNFLLIISGREKLNENDWSDNYSLLSHFELDPFTRDEIVDYLRRLNITSDKVIKTIYELTGGLPILVATLAEQFPTNPEAVEDVEGTAIERFLKWVDDPNKRLAAIHASIPRYLNQDVIDQIIPDGDSASLFLWLQKMPFVTKRENGFWAYHDIVRSLMLRYQNQISPDEWKNLHGRMGDFYEKKRTELHLEENEKGKHHAWKQYSLEILYHRLCHSRDSYMKEAINGLVSLWPTFNESDLLWAKTMEKAESDLGIDNGLGKFVADRLKSLYADKDYHKGIQLYDRLLSDEFLEKSNLPRVYYMRGISFQDLEEYEKAISDFSTAIRLNPTFGLAYHARGHSFESQDDYENALRNFSDAIELEPGKAQYYICRGNIFETMNQLENALIDKDKAIELVQDNDGYFHSRAHCYLLMGEKEKALQDFSRAVELDPSDAANYYCRGNCYDRLKQYDRAISDKTHAIELDPTEGSHYHGRAHSYQYLHKYDEAILDFNQSILISPTDDKHFYCRGLCYFEFQRYADAIHDFDYAISLNPNKAIYYYDKYLCFIEIEDVDAALSEITKAIGLNPGNDKYYALRANGYFELQNYDKAIQDLDHAIGINPTISEYFWVRAKCYIGCGQKEKALEDNVNAIAIDPDQGDYYFISGLNSGLVVQYLKKLATTNEKLCKTILDGMLSVAVAHYNKGNFDKTRELFEMTLQVSPQNAIAQNNLAFISICYQQWGVALSLLKKAEANGYDQMNILFTNRGYIEMHQGRASKAIKDFLSALESEGVDEEVYLHVAYPDEQGIIHNPTDDFPMRSVRGKILILANLATAYYIHQDVQKALDTIREAIALDPLESTGYRVLGCIYYRMKQYKDARAVWNKALESAATDDEKAITLKWIGELSV